ncbi:MAG: hypothetical protein ACI9TV_002759 [Sulfurimonas sp.]|jgi:hypothetical protein|uniref:CZB domain-containing protein n=1 Tax=Sulfurimonas sp. TaxID=2022749 RepID=UPI0039E4A014
MEKLDLVSNVRAARTAHIKWVQKAKLLINGLDVQEGAIPVDSTECEFGKWFYDKGQILNSLTNNTKEEMERIEDLHSKLHDQYLEIFNIYFNKVKTGWLCKIFGIKRRNVSDEEQKLAKKHFESMEVISKDLLEEINKLEQLLIAVSEEDVKILI